jgi:CRISPR-associated protein Cmr3
MQGVIRTHHIALHGSIDAYLRGQLPEIEKIIGKPGEPVPSSFKLRGPFIAKRVGAELKRYFPLPLDAYLFDVVYRSLKATPAVDCTVLTDLDSRYQVLWRDKGADPEKTDSGKWLDEEALQEYLTKQRLPVERVVTSKELFDRESRFGIQRSDETRATQSGQLYEAEFIRPCSNIGLCVEVDGLPDWPESGIIGIGGENRAGRYTWWTSQLPAVRTELTTSGKFKVIFLTPTYFNGGWQPENTAQHDDWSRFFPKAKCVAAAVGRPLILGGYDLARGEHKPSRRYVPAGSVYYFEGEPWLERDTITDDGAEIGFGQYIIGGW